MSNKELNEKELDKVAGGIIPRRAQLTFNIKAYKDDNIYDVVKLDKVVYCPRPTNEEVLKHVHQIADDYCKQNGYKKYKVDGPIRVERIW